jgi:hypothetical protein
VERDLKRLSERRLRSLLIFASLCTSKQTFHFDIDDAEFHVEYIFICLFKSYKNLFPFTTKSATDKLSNVTLLCPAGWQELLFIIVPNVVGFRHIPNRHCLISLNSLDPHKLLPYYFPLSLCILFVRCPVQCILGAISPGANRPKREADQSLQTSAEVKKIWIYESTPLYTFMA